MNDEVRRHWQINMTTSVIWKCGNNAGKYEEEYRKYARASSQKRNTDLLKVIGMSVEEYI